MIANRFCAYLYREKIDVSCKRKMYHYRTVFDNEYRAFYAYSLRKGARVIGYVPCDFAVVDKRLRDGIVNTVKVMVAIDAYHKRVGTLPLALFQEYCVNQATDRRKFVAFYKSLVKALDRA